MALQFRAPLILVENVESEPRRTPDTPEEGGIRGAIDGRCDV